MSLSPPRVRTPAITWMWPEAIRGAICALPGAVILLAFNVSLGICFALGTLPVAMLGVPPARKARPRLVAAGLGFAVVYALGNAAFVVGSPGHITAADFAVPAAWTTAA